MEGLHGKGGGYRLTRKPEDYTLFEILNLTEGSLAPVCCLEADAPDCPREKVCRTVSMWRELDAMVSDFLSSKTLADLMKDQSLD